MNQVEIAQRQEFYDRATQIVRIGQSHLLPGVQRLLQIVIHPTFDNVLGWEICLNASKAEATYLALCTKWNKVKDLEKLSIPVEQLKYLNRLSPTIEFHRFDIEKSFAESLIDSFQSISVPAFITGENFGCDGTSYEVNIGDPWAGLQFKWWENPPQAWQQIGEITFEASEKLNRLLAQSE